MKPTKYLLFLCVFCLNLSYIFGQQATPKTTFVHWTTSEDCKICDRVAIEGDEFRILDDENLTLAIHPALEDGYWVTDVVLINKGANRFDFDPLKGTGFIAWKTKDEFINGSEKTEVFPAVNPVAIVKKMQRRTAWANAFTAFGASMQRQTATVNTTSSGTATATSTNGRSASGTYNGTSTATISAPDTASQQRAQRQVQENNANIARTGNTMIDMSLKANTYFQNTKVSGTVYYPRKKNFDVIEFRFAINGKVYTFTYFVGKEKK